MQQAQKLIDQAQKCLYNTPKQASYYAAQASALFPEDEPSEVRAQAMFLYCQAEQLLGNFDWVSRIYMILRNTSPPQTSNKVPNYTPSWDVSTANWETTTKP